MTQKELDNAIDDCIMRIQANMADLKRLENVRFLEYGVEPEGRIFSEDENGIVEEMTN